MEHKETVTDAITLCTIYTLQSLNVYKTNVNP